MRRLELISKTDANGVLCHLVRFDDSAERCDWRPVAQRAEIGVTIFEAADPIAGDGILPTSADGPTHARLVATINRARPANIALANISKRGAARHIEKRTIPRVA